MDDAEERSLDLVQRLVISALLLVVMGAPTVALAAYGASSPIRSHRMRRWDSAS